MARTMVSPSNSMRVRTVPCMAGCEGPMLMSIRLVWRCASSSPSSASRPAGVTSMSMGSAMGPVGNNRKRFWVRALLSHARGAGTAEDVLDGPLGRERLSAAQRVVLSQRVSLEFLVHEDARQPGVAHKADAVEVPDEALPPVGALVDAHQARQ